MEDAQIIQLYWDRDEQAIAQTRDKHGRFCRSVAWNVLRSEPDVEECLNDTWLRAWNAMPTDWPQALRAYLGRITRNLAISRYRAAHADKRGGGVLPCALEELGDCVSDRSVEQTVEARELARLISAFVRALPPESGDLFVRRYWYLDSIEQLASRFHMSESRVKSNLFRTRKRLRAYLEQEGIAL